MSTPVDITVPERVAASRARQGLPPTLDPRLVTFVADWLEEALRPRERVVRKGERVA